MGKRKLWCVGIRPEGDSPHEKTPALSKEIAERALERYRSMWKAEGNSFVLENIDDLIQVQQWHGTRKEHENKMLYTEEWFKQAMYQCQNIKQAEIAFQYGEIVHCYNGSAELITKDFDEAKKFYGVTV